MADVVTLNGTEFKAEETRTEPLLRNPADHLRLIAKDIDDGKYGDVGSMVLCILGNQFHLFCGGTDHSPGDMTMLLEAGILRVARDIERHGE